MAKVRAHYECSRCHRDIEYGDCNAYYYDGNLYCCEDCAMEAAYIDEYDWSDDYEYEYTSDESNGYGIKLISRDWYGNGAYVIWDKCPFEFDDDYKDGFGLQENCNFELVDMLTSVFDEHADDFKTIEDPFDCPTGKFEMQIWIERHDNPDHKRKKFYRVGSHFFDKDAVDFIIRMLNNGDNKPSQIKVYVDNPSGTYALFIVCNNKRAVLAECQTPIDCYNIDDF